MKTVRATIDQNGEVHLHDSIELTGPREAIVTILENDEQRLLDETAILSEAALAVDWDRPEEDEAWRHLRPATSS